MHTKPRQNKIYVTTRLNATRANFPATRLHILTCCFSVIHKTKHEGDTVLAGNSVGFQRLPGLLGRHLPVQDSGGEQEGLFSGR